MPFGRRERVSGRPPVCAQEPGGRVCVQGCVTLDVSGGQILCRATIRVVLCKGRIPRFFLTIYESHFLSHDAGLELTGKPEALGKGFFFFCRYCLVSCRGLLACSNGAL